jgi:hypothetical protein
LLADVGVADHLSPLAGKEPPGMIAGEESNDKEEEDDGERRESNSEAFSQEAVDRTRRTKRGTDSSLQQSWEEGIEEEEEEETNYPPEGRDTTDPPSGPQPKLLRQTILEGGMALQRPLGAVPRSEWRSESSRGVGDPHREVSFLS